MRWDIRRVSAVIRRFGRTHFNTEAAALAINMQKILIFRLLYDIVAPVKTDRNSSGQGAIPISRSE